MTEHRIGVISDTHGLVRPQAVKALRGVEMILHAGDIGKPEVLDELNRIAPVTAVRGNVDKGEWAERLPEWETAEIAGTGIYMLHNLNELEIVPEAAGFGVVVSGHSHKPIAETRRGVLYLNPGSAGPRRFSLPVALAILTIGENGPSAQIIELSV